MERQAEKRMEHEMEPVSLAAFGRVSGREVETQDN